MRRINYISLVIIVFFFSCNKHLKYEDRWIILHAEYKGENIIPYTGPMNFTINFDKGGFTPSVNYNQFNDLDITYETNFSTYREKGIDYLVVEGSIFFTDTFAIQCLGDMCCEIILETKDKYLELMYNGPLSTHGKRRDCPDVNDILDEIYGTTSN